MRIFLLSLLTLVAVSAAAPATYDYQLLATSRIGTMQKEMNQAAAKGFQYSHFVGGDTSFGGQEVVVIMSRHLNVPEEAPKSYEVISAALTSNLEKDLKRAGEDGYEFRASVLFREGSASPQPVCILERTAGTTRKFAYRLIATARTSTMQKELQDAGRDGFSLLGVTLSKTLLGVGEVVAILAKAGE